MKVLDTHSIKRVSGGLIQTGDSWGNGEEYSRPSSYDHFACEVGATGMGDNASYGTGSSGVANPNACQSSVLGSGGLAAAIGGALGTIISGGWGAVGVLAGALLGGVAGSGSPACGPTYKG